MVLPTERSIRIRIFLARILSLCFVPFRWTKRCLPCLITILKLPLQMVIFAFERAAQAIFIYQAMLPLLLGIFMIFITMIGVFPEAQHPGTYQEISREEYDFARGKMLYRMQWPVLHWIIDFVSLAPIWAKAILLYMGSRITLKAMDSVPGILAKFGFEIFFCVMLFPDDKMIQPLLERLELVYVLASYESEDGALVQGEVMTIIAEYSDLA